MFLMFVTFWKVTVRVWSENRECSRIKTQNQHLKNTQEFSHNSRVRTWHHSVKVRRTAKQVYSSHCQSKTHLCCPFLLKFLKQLNGYNHVRLWHLESICLKATGSTAAHDLTQTSHREPLHSLLLMTPKGERERVKERLSEMGCLHRNRVRMSQ